MSDNMIIIHEKDWDGALYPVQNRKDKVVITLSGSEGGMRHAEKLALFLQDNGIPALAFGYFKTKHTQKNLDRMPLELIGKAIDWLVRNDYEKIAVEGVSKGAEYALAAAITYPKLSCVIIKTPSWFYSEGMIGRKPSGDSCWSYKGGSIPYTPYKEQNWNILKMILKAREYNILEINIGKKVLEESVIPVEKISAPILIFSTKADTIWPSAESGDKLYSRLKENNFQYKYKHICFKHMSHMMLENCGSEIKWFIKSEREFPKECHDERKIMGSEIINWIENIWE